MDSPGKPGTSSSYNSICHRNYNVAEDQAYTLNSKKLRSKLNWKDEISLTVGLEEVVTWVYNNIGELKKQPLEYIHKK